MACPSSVRVSLSVDASERPRALSSASEELGSGINFGSGLFSENADDRLWDGILDEDLGDFSLCLSTRWGQLQPVDFSFEMPGLEWSIIVMLEAKTKE